MFGCAILGSHRANGEGSLLAGTNHTRASWSHRAPSRRTASRSANGTVRSTRGIAGPRTAGWTTCTRVCERRRTESRRDSAAFIEIRALQHARAARPVAPRELHGRVEHLDVDLGGATAVDGRLQPLALLPSGCLADQPVPAAAFGVPAVPALAQRVLRLERRAGRPEPQRRCCRRFQQPAEGHPSRRRQRPAQYFEQRAAVDLAAVTVVEKAAQPAEVLEFAAAEAL